MFIQPLARRVHEGIQQPWPLFSYRKGTSDRDGGHADHRRIVLGFWLLHCIVLLHIGLNWPCKVRAGVPGSWAQEDSNMDLTDANLFGVVLILQRCSLISNH